MALCLIISRKLEKHLPPAGALRKTPIFPLFSFFLRALCEKWFFRGFGFVRMSHTCGDGVLSVWNPF
jgi:hypothetical protein